MAEKKSQYKEYVEKFRKSRKPQKKPGAPVVIGKAYSPEEISEMLSDLRSEERERSIAAAIKFSEGSESVKAEASKDPNIDIKSVTENVVNVIKADSEIILPVLEETKKAAALEYIAKSEKIPEPIRGKADAALKRLHLQEDAQKFEIKKEADLEVKAFAPEAITALWKDLRSKNKDVQIKAAITVFTFYSKISEAMPKIPNLTISQLMVRAKDITYQNTDPLFRQVIKTWNRAALGFLSTSKTMPPKIRDRADAALKAMGEAPKIIAPKPEVKKPEEEEKVKIGKEEVQVKKPEHVPAEFDVPRVKRLAVELRSREHDRSIVAAINLFSNYQEISQVVAKIPLLTISQLKDKACSIASAHSNDFFQKLTLQNNLKALEFIAKSEAIPPKLRKKANEVIEQLLHGKPKDKAKLVPKIIMDEGGKPDDEGD